MKRVLVHHLLITIGALLPGNSTAEPLPMNAKVTANSVIVDRGMEIARLKGLGTITNGLTFSIWSFPHSIDVNGENYGVCNDEGVFSITSHTNSAIRLAVGSVSRVKDCQTAVTCGLGSLSMNNMNVWSAANTIGITCFSLGSNTVYHARSHGNRFNDVLICRNIFVRITSGHLTNNVDFAMALLNAGLPESERLPNLLSCQPRL